LGGFAVHSHFSHDLEALRLPGSGRRTIVRKWLALVAALAMAVPALAHAQSLPVVMPAAANNAALSALPHTAYSAVVRLGYAVIGDAPPLAYTPSASPCSLNAGAGDGGSQVPTSDGGCWLAVFYGPGDIREWGAVGNANIRYGCSITATTNSLSCPTAAFVSGGISATAPTVTSGLATSPTVSANGTAAFTVTVGATGSASTAEVLGMPTAANELGLHRDR
jgi:hypothetical protein